MTLKEKARTLLNVVDADEKLWVEAINTAAVLHNVTPTRGNKRTPFELFYGRRPSVAANRKWGCLAYVKPPDIHSWTTI